MRRENALLHPPLRGGSRPEGTRGGVRGDEAKHGALWVGPSAPFAGDAQNRKRLAPHHGLATHSCTPSLRAMSNSPETSLPPQPSSVQSIGPSCESIPEDEASARSRLGVSSQIMIQHLFLSPHFDDAIGSCGGIIGRLVNLGHPVRVLTAFGGVECEPFSMPARVLHREWKLKRPVSHRRLEDAAACGLLGCESSFLEFPDAIYRQGGDGRHLYPTFESLRGSVAREDRALPERLASRLGDYLSGKDAVVYCPMAIGGHVDHVLARDCGRVVSAGDRCVVYYRDFYYDRTWDGHVEDAALKHVNIALTGQELGKKVAAFSEYKSQISGLFESQAAMSCYFAEIGNNETMLLPRPTTAAPLRILLSVLEQAAEDRTARA
jgi:LmbE family N-acetylglucosaminyl deacetylase